MSSTQKQIASLQKRVASIENQLKQDANLSEIREMLADIVRSVKNPGQKARVQDVYEAAKRPPSHVVQTRFRAL